MEIGQIFSGRLDFLLRTVPSVHFSTAYRLARVDCVCTIPRPYQVTCTRRELLKERGISFGVMLFLLGLAGSSIIFMQPVLLMLTLSGIRRLIKMLTI